MSQKNKKIKDHILQACALAYQHATEKEKNWVQEFLASLLKKANVTKWEVTSHPNEYELELAQEIVGQHPKIPIGELVLKQKMKIAFMEVQKPGNLHYRLQILFPDQGIFHRMGLGWLSKNTPLERIVIEEDHKHQVWCTIEGMGQILKKTADEALDFWNQTNWS